MIDLYIHLIISIKVHAPLNELIIPFILKRSYCSQTFLIIHLTCFMRELVNRK